MSDPEEGDGSDRMEIDSERSSLSNDLYAEEMRQEFASEIEDEGPNSSQKGVRFFKWYFFKFVFELFFSY